MTRPDNAYGSRVASRGLGLLLATLMSVGCQVAFGTYKAGGDPASVDAGGGTGGVAQSNTVVGGAAQGGATAMGGASGAGGATDWGECDGDRLYTCVDVALLACVNGRWVSSDTCEKVSLCNPTTGHCDKCAQDERRCGPTSDGGTGVFVCDDPQVGFTLGTACKQPLYCADDVQRCVLCEAEETHCLVSDAGVSMSAKRCNGSRSDFDTVSCWPECTITGGKTDRCPICTDGSTVCQPTGSGVWLLRLCVVGTWTTKQTCPGECLQATDVTPASCL